MIVGAGEVGPYGSARTRFEMEVDEKALGRRCSRTGLEHRTDPLGHRTQTRLVRHRFR